jgi:membrane-anchored mycosin MYCP
MADPVIGTGRVEKYNAHQLVVALPHLVMAKKHLTRLGATFDGKNVLVEKDEELGLALVTFTEAQAQHAVRMLESRDWERPGPDFTDLVHDLATQRGGMDRVNDVDKILVGLRRLFANRYGGWYPVLGKNRYVERVVGQPHVGGGGEGDPKPIDPYRPFTPRGGEPGYGARVGVLDTALVPADWLRGGYVETPSALERERSSSWLRPAEPWNHWQGHSTFVTGLILQQAPGAVVVPRRVLDANGDGDNWTVAKELVRLARSDVQIVNCSFLTRTDDNQPPLLFQRAVERLAAADFVIVAAAGNLGTGEPVFPAAQPDVVAVAAVDENLQPMSYSHPTPWHDISSRGDNRISTFLNGRVKGRESTRDFKGLAEWSGTSFAAAIVSGIVAAGTRPGYRSAGDVLRGLLASDTCDSEDRPFVRPVDPLFETSS